MKYITTVLVSAFVGMDVAHAANTVFTDDKGIGHTIVAGSKIVCGAMDAITMHHFGMEASQIKGTFGERSSSGSNYGGSYFNVSTFFSNFNLFFQGNSNFSLLSCATFLRAT